MSAVRRWIEDLGLSSNPRESRAICVATPDHRKRRRQDLLDDVACRSNQTAGCIKLNDQ
jgi:hypothetical protein